MGYLHPKIYEIPEGPIDFILDYFADPRATAKSRL
jgi:hypothetical protein